MLTELLPGLRDLRSALAAGYMWLAFGWLALHDQVDEADGPIRDLVTLGGDLSDVGLGVAASFIAYLIGSLSEDIFVRWFIRWMDNRGVLAKRFGGEQEDVERINDPDLVREELTRLENAANRAQSEAQLRVALVAPTLAILIYLAVEDDPAWLAGVVVVGALVGQAWVRVRDWFFANTALSAFRSKHNLIESPQMGTAP